MAPARGTRPTQERVREALFSRWCDRLPEARFLELFAGSGVVGLEALSRGAGRVLFVERSRTAIDTLRRNAQDLGVVVGAAVVERRELPAGCERLEAPGPRFDLIYADPPYAFPLLAELLRGTAPLLAGAGELALEHSARRQVPASAVGLELVDRRRYGETELTFYRASDDATT